ncbi:MAG: mechanosensitive ion channel [Saprospiraceae bacterium]|nr:mechanosensitive ion channel [Saprospiraceae bacterium]
MEYLNNLFTNVAGRFGDALPTLLGAILLLVVGLIFCGFLRRLAFRLLSKIKFGKMDPATSNTLARTISKLVYYLAVTYLLLLILNMLGITGVLEPLQNMLDGFVGFIPNIVAAGLIGFIGYTLASIAREVVGLISESIESLATRIGIDGNLDLTKLVKQLVFLFVFIPILIIALDALKMEVISRPATEMLQSLIGSIPNILAAAVILAVFFIIGRFVSTIVGELLENMGLNTLTNRIGIGQLLGSGRSLSGVVSGIVFFFIMFAGVVSALEKLELTQLSGILGNVMQIGGQIFFGIVLLIAGNFIAKFVADYFESTGASGMAGIARFAVLGLVLAIALKSMGIADDIVNLAFGLTLGAVAVAFALSFGLGGREAAGKQMDHFLRRFRND